MICLLHVFIIFFFFSSRRRHTRLQGDWSSDVCSSDLISLRLHARREPRISMQCITQRLARDWLCAGCVASIGTGSIPRAARGERKSRRGARRGEQRVRLAARASVTSAPAEHTGPQVAWAPFPSVL